MTTSADVLQEVLAAQHAAVYGYGAAGALLSGQQRRQALADLDHHRNRRDRLRSMVLGAGAEPVESAAAYELPADLREAGGAARLIERLESDMGVAFAALVAASTDDERAFAARALADTAVRAARWSGDAARYPGLLASPEPPVASPAAT
jgi:hypothetical protein